MFKTASNDFEAIPICIQSYGTTKANENQYILLPVSTVNKELTMYSISKNNLFRKKKGLQSSTYSHGELHRREGSSRGGKRN